MIIVYGSGKIKFRYIKTGEYHPEADYATILLNIEDFRVKGRIRVSNS